LSFAPHLLASSRLDDMLVRLDGGDGGATEGGEGPALTGSRDFD